MKISRMLIPTLKEDPQEAELESHRLMMRAGMLRRLASGVYNYLPLGYRAIQKVMQVIREEMNAIGAQELLMPALNPKELWEETGRWEVMGENMFRLKDRWKRDFCLGMTHEEVITDIVRREVKSYRELPVSLYQIQSKFRDEPRPRGGVLRGREFIMKDAYSFHKNTESLDETYRDFYKAYHRIFKRCGMEASAVDADPGAIGGTDNHEFMVRSDAGEDFVFSCQSCSYSANKEMAYFKDPEGTSSTGSGKPEKIHTPNASTIEQLCKFLGTTADNFIKSLIYIADGNPIMALVRGDRELNETKLRRALGVKKLEMATAEQIEKFTGGGLGFSGPVNMQGKTIIADPEIKFMKNAVTGANETDYHLKNVTPEADFKATRYAQIRAAEEGDLCPKCGAVMDTYKAIELGHIFKLGTKYSQAMDASFLDEDGAKKIFIMGCYGIGVTRIPAAVIEVNYDKDGIIWPIEIAPYQVAVIPMISTDEAQRKIAEDIYSKLLSSGIDVVIDDRDERPGFKLKDADLIGYPVRVVVGGKAVKENLVEVKLRREKEPVFFNVEEAADKVIEVIDQEIKNNRIKLEQFEECPC